MMFLLPAAFLSFSFYPMEVKNLDKMCNELPAASLSMVGLPLLYKASKQDDQHMCNQAYQIISAAASKGGQSVLQFLETKNDGRSCFILGLMALDEKNYKLASDYYKKAVDLCLRQEKKLTQQVVYQLQKFLERKKGWSLLPYFANLIDGEMLNSLEHDEQNGDMHARFIRGVALYARNKWEYALSCLKPVADQGNSLAQFCVADILHDGSEFVHSPHDAAKYYKEALKKTTNSYIKRWSLEALKELFNQGIVEAIAPFFIEGLTDEAICKESMVILHDFLNRDPEEQRLCFEQFTHEYCCLLKEHTKKRNWYANFLLGCSRCIEGIIGKNDLKQKKIFLQQALKCLRDAFACVVEEERAFVNRKKLEVMEYLAITYVKEGAVVQAYNCWKKLEKENTYAILLEDVGSSDNPRAQLLMGFMCSEKSFTDGLSWFQKAFEDEQASLVTRECAAAMLIPLLNRLLTEKFNIESEEVMGYIITKAQIKTCYKVIKFFIQKNDPIFLKKVLGLFEDTENAVISQYIQDNEVISLVLRLGIYDLLFNLIKAGDVHAGEALVNFHSRRLKNKCYLLENEISEEAEKRVINLADELKESQVSEINERGKEKKAILYSAYKWLASCFDKEEKYVKYLQEALEYNPGDQETRYNLAIRYLVTPPNINPNEFVNKTIKMLTDLAKEGYREAQTSLCFLYSPETVCTGGVKKNKRLSEYYFKMTEGKPSKMASFFKVGPVQDEQITIIGAPVNDIINDAVKVSQLAEKCAGEAEKGTLSKEVRIEMSQKAGLMIKKLKEVVEGKKPMCLSATVQLAILSIFCAKVELCYENFIEARDFLIEAIRAMISAIDFDFVTKLSCKKSKRKLKMALDYLNEVTEKLSKEHPICRTLFNTLIEKFRRNGLEIRQEQ